MEFLQAQRKTLDSFLNMQEGVFFLQNVIFWMDVKL